MNVAIRITDKKKIEHLLDRHQKDGPRIEYFNIDVQDWCAKNIQVLERRGRLSCHLSSAFNAKTAEWEHMYTIWFANERDASLFKVWWL